MRRKRKIQYTTQARSFVRYKTYFQYCAVSVACIMSTTIIAPSVIAQSPQTVQQQTTIEGINLFLCDVDMPSGYGVFNNRYYTSSPEWTTNVTVDHSVEIEIFGDMIETVTGSITLPTGAPTVTAPLS